MRRIQDRATGAFPPPLNLKKGRGKGGNYAIVQNK